MKTSEEPAFVESALAVPSGRLLLVVTVGKERGKVTELVARLALRGPIYVAAGSDWLPGDRLTRAIRRRTMDVEQTLEQIQLARAFTCYQLVDLLAEIPSDHHPLLVLDFLHTLFNADIPLRTRFRTLKECCRHLQRLSQYKPVAIIIQQMPVADYQYFYPFLAAIANEILLPETEPEGASQLDLF